MDKGTRVRREALSLGPSRSPGLGNREAYHATKAALAGLRPRGTRSARDRNGYDWTARTAYVKREISQINVLLDYRTPILFMEN